MQRFYFGRWLLCLALLLVTGYHSAFAALNSTRQQTPTIDQVLWWLPQDTETLLVSRGPFLIKTQELQSRPQDYRKPATERDFQNFHWTFSSMQAGGFVKELQDQTILLSMEGSRKVSLPKDLGMTPYEGCSILLVKENAQKPLNSVFKALSAKAKQRITLAGQQVLVYENKQEQDIWKRYVACPAKDVFLVATNRSYLESVLLRMRHKPSARALSNSLPQWKYVDRNAQYWAVCNLNQGRSTQRYASVFGIGDEGFTGTTLSFNPRQSRKASIHYFSKSKDALAQMKQLWINPQEGVNAQVVRRSATTTQIVVDFDQKGQRLATFTFYILGFLGHAIIV